MISYFCIINIILSMEPNQFSLFQLPQRQSKVAIQLPNTQKRTFTSNYYEISLPKNSQIFQYYFDTTPQIQQDSRSLLFQVIRNIKRVLKEKIGLITASGNMLWGETNIKMPFKIQTQFKFQGIQHNFQVLVKPTKSLNISDLIKTPDGLTMVFQIFNNKLKAKLKNLNMDEITRGSYFDKKEVKVTEVGLNILRGFKFTLCKLIKGLTLQIDVCSKVIRSASLLQQLLRLSPEQAKAFEGDTVITRYGRYRTYKILKIDYSQSPKSQFYHEQRAGKISYAKYYEESYGVKIKSLNQPLIEVCLRIDKKLINNAMQKVQKTGFLIPELVALTGMSDQQRADSKTMKAIAYYTKINPKDRIAQIESIKQDLTGNDIKIDDFLTMQGYQLLEPYILLKSKKHLPKDGSFRFKDALDVIFDPKDWFLVYSQRRNNKNDDGNEALDFVDILETASKVFDIRVSSPQLTPCDQNINSWKTQINNNIKKNGKPQIIVLLISRFQQGYYSELKRFITCDLQLPSQFVKKRTLSKGNPIAAASMILIQMNQKMGGSAWQVRKEIEKLYKKDMMYGAFSISKGKRGFTLAFVGTLDSQCTKVISYCKSGLKNKEDIPKAIFQTIFENWAKAYLKQNKHTPETIIVYRQGLSIPQIKVQLPNQIDALEKTILKIGKQTNKQDYRPQVVYLTVNKKINTRFFEEQQDKKSKTKHTVEMVNPRSGSCIFDELSVNTYDFHLASQNVTQGTCTPTQYIVVHNTSTLTQEQLAQFTYEQTFNYYNWQGAVKVPACMQCADKLAKLVGESIHTNITEGEITKGFFFL